MAGLAVPAALLAAAAPAGRLLYLPDDRRVCT
jgi:hypothetical protein